MSFEHLTRSLFYIQSPLCNTYLSACHGRSRYTYQLMRSRPAPKLPACTRLHWQPTLPSGNKLYLLMKFHYLIDLRPFPRFNRNILFPRGCNRRIVLNLESWPACGNIRQTLKLSAAPTPGEANIE